MASSDEDGSGNSLGGSEVDTKETGDSATIFELFRTADIIDYASIFIGTVGSFETLMISEYCIS